MVGNLRPGEDVEDTFLCEIAYKCLSETLDRTYEVGATLKYL